MTSKPDGELYYTTGVLGGILPNYYSTIIYTDYETYFVQYYCMQQWFDFYTKEYVDIYVREGAADLSAETLAQIKSNIKKSMPNFDEGGLVAAVETDCAIKDTWGFL